MFQRARQSDDHYAGGRSSPFEHPQGDPPMPLGRRAFIAGTVGALAATAVASTAQAAVPAGASYFEPLDPVRLADTRTYASYARESKNFQRLSDRKIRINIRNSPYATVPTDAVAVVVSLAAIFNGPVRHPQGWVKAVPAGTTTEVSNINMENGDGAVANLATVKIGPGGKIDVQGQFPYDVVVDILGVYRATSTAVRAGRMEFLSETRRELTLTRMTKGSWRTVKLSVVPTHAQAVAVNLTVDQCRTDGFVTALGQRTAGQPKVSNLNHVSSETRAAGAIVKIGQSGGVASIELYSHGDANVILDVTGYITGPTEPSSPKEDGLFVPINPTRVMDTRRAADFARTGKKRLWPGWTRPFELPNNTGGFGPRTQMKGVVMNATLVTAMKLGFVTVLPARTPRREVSNLNAARVGHIVANHVICQASTKGVEMFAHCGGDVIADVAGWYVGAPKQPTFTNPTLDSQPPIAQFNWILQVPRMGLQNWVIPHANGDVIVDGGNSWWWTGKIGVGGDSIVAFGHRTSGSAPYRRQHELVSGDRLYVYTPDARRYEYRFVGEQLTNHLSSQIHNAARTNSAGTTFSLVSCTGRGVPKAPGVKNDQPLGGIAWRLVSTFVMVGWTDERPNVG